MTAPVVRFARPEALPAPDTRFVVVEASAGTGKTFFLEHRVADLILAGAELGEILLVTFTDKAVAELRARVRDLLDRMARATESTSAASAWSLDDAARARLRAAIGAFDHAQIFTIHGFCHRVLVEDAFAARRLLQQRQVADEDAFADAFGALLRERFATAAPDRDLLALYLERGRTVDQLRDLLLECARAGGVPRRRFEPVRAAAIADALVARFGNAELRARVQAQVARSHTRWAPDWLADIGEAVARIDRARPATVLAACDALREPAGKLLARIPASDAAAALTEACGELSLDEAIAAELLPHVIARVGVDKAERGLYDYDDMLRLVRDALVGAGAAPTSGSMTRGARDTGRELATRLRTRTPWAMIDEFQDTDPVQWDIFRTVWLADGARGDRTAAEMCPPGDGIVAQREARRGSVPAARDRGATTRSATGPSPASTDLPQSGLCIVGDPKQAIYGFRGADVQTYVHARDELERVGAARVVLETNRRSTAPLVEAVNELLAGGAPLATPLLAGAIAYDHPVTAAGEVVCDGTRAPVTVFALRTAGKDASKAALAGAIGAEIERLRAAPPVWRARGQMRPFALGDCLVLTRINKESAAIAAALRARGLACELREADRLFETREAAELAAVLAAVAAPRDRSARLRALRTRFFDVPWHELMAIVDAPDHHPVIARLHDWAALATRRAYEPLFRRLVEDSSFAERALVLGGGERALVNTWHLIELLLEEVGRSRGDLHELVVQLRRWITDGADHVDDRDVQRVETDGDAVRIMTIHKAKGLEAPYVFLYGCTSSPKRNQVHALRDGATSARALVVGRRDEATAKRIDDETAGEHERLAYVALTRAQVRLYLPLYGDDIKLGASMYAPIQRCLAPLAARAHPRFEVVEVAAVAALPSASTGVLADLDVPRPPAVAERAAIAGMRAGIATVSYTRIAHAHGDARASATDLALDPAELASDDDRDPREGRVAAGELPPGAGTGLFLHDVLEHVDLDAVRAAPDADAWAARPETRALLAEHARARGIAEEYWPHAARVVYATLAAPLACANADALPPLVSARAFAREVEFAYPIESPGSAGARSNAERCGDPIESPGSAGARSNAERCGDPIESPGSAGARSNAERCGDPIESPGSAGARSNAERCGDPIESPGSAGARSNAERCGDPIESPGSAGARSNAERCGDPIESPGSAGARSNAERCGDPIESPGSAGARALVRGFIDAMVAWDDELWVVDYKSDVLDGPDLARAAAARVEQRYGVQLRLYALAATRMRGARPLAGLVFAFVRYNLAVTVRVSDDQLAAWTRWLDELPMEAA